MLTLGQNLQMATFDPRKPPPSHQDLKNMLSEVESRRRYWEDLKMIGFFIMGVGGFLLMIWLIGSIINDIFGVL